MSHCDEVDFDLNGIFQADSRRFIESEPDDTDAEMLRTLQSALMARGGRQ